METEENEKLMSLAEKAKENSYSPYSKFRVGAALITNDGKIYTGCNIENSSYGGTICAERTALLKAVSEGEKTFKKLAVASDLEDYTFPCGICLQVISEFMPDGEIILKNKTSGLKIFKLSELLPHAFKETR